MKSAAQYSIESWDSSQKCVIESDRSARLIVEAGPGTGKTAVSCARLAFLIREKGVQPSKCWMISFTRTAVAEIRARLYGYLGEDSFSVKVATIDAQAWAIHSGFDAAASLTGSYERNIEDVLKLVRTSEEVQDYLDGIEHLILDEAQDFVGGRADLIQEIVQALNPETGITVFADEAQAIYGFADGSLGTGDGKSLLGRLQGSKKLRFEDVALDTVHRTKAIGLLRIFTDVRKILTKSPPKRGVFDEIKSGILRHANSNTLTNQSLVIDALPANTLILFRKRSQALEKSQFAECPHSLRLQGYSVNLPPWIALCFWDYQQSHIDKQSFAKLWLERVESRCPPDYDMADAWDRLVRAGGGPDGSIDLKLLRIRLGKFSAPVELTSNDFGLPGPVIGTIHASKGREADNVILLMHEVGEFENTSAEADEARVLFVGSTRARSTLRVGKTTKWTGSSIETNRAYRKVPDQYKKQKDKVTCMIEVGRPEDISASGFVGRSAMSQPDAVKAQAWLADRAGAMVTGLNLKSEADHNYDFKLFVPDTALLLGWLSPRFRSDMWEVAKALAAGVGRKVNPPSRVAYVKALGSRTVVVPPDSSELGSLHSPWAQTGFLLAPRVASFTSAGFWKTK